MCKYYSIMPPHILSKIIENGDENQRKRALLTLTHGQRLHGQREILGRYDLSAKNFNEFRVVQNADNKEDLIAPVARKEGQSEVDDKAVNEAYDNTGAVYQFYKSVYNRNSIDNKGMKIFSTVHYGVDFDNAFWNGERMVFGDGDGKVFTRFTKCLDVIGHELTHGVTNSAIQMVYKDQSGALQEAISDVFGCLVKQNSLNQTADEGDWVIGEGLFTKKVNGVGIRSLKAPGTAYDDPTLGKDPCPATMADYVNTNQDDGGVHINCTIPGHAAYLSAIEIGGYAWEKVGRIWYNTVQKRLTNVNTDFKEFAELTLKVAKKVFGAPEHKAIESGWTQTGVL